MLHFILVCVSSTRTVNKIQTHDKKVTLSSLYKKINKKNLCLSVSGAGGGGKEQRDRPKGIKITRENAQELGESDYTQC